MCLLIWARRVTRRTIRAAPCRSSRPAFERHYREVQVPLTPQIPGLRSYVLSRGITPVRGEDPYYLAAELDFDGLAALQAAFRSPQGRATAGRRFTERFEPATGR